MHRDFGRERAAKRRHWRWTTYLNSIAKVCRAKFSINQSSIDFNGTIFNTNNHMLLQSVKIWVCAVNEAIHMHHTRVVTIL